MSFIVVSITKRGRRKVRLMTNGKVAETLKWLRQVYPFERHTGYRLEPYREYRP